jgi:hypothetical protein
MCFENLIGLRDAKGDDLIASSSGHYINDLPGISVDILNDAKDRESESALDVVTKQFAHADRLIEQRVREWLGNRYQIKSLLDTTVVGQYYDRDQVQADQAYNVGLKFTLQRNPHAQIHFSRISLSVRTNNPVTVNLWDLWSGDVLKTVTITPTVGGIVSQEIDWTIEARGRDLRLFLGYDQDGFDTYETPIGSRACNCTGEKWNLKHVLVNSRKASNASAMLNDDLEANTGTSGLSVEASVSCGTSHLLCSLKDHLAVAKLYYAGYLLARYAKYSQRLNPTVLSFQGDYDELAEIYQSEFEANIKSSLDNIQIPSSTCFKCNSPAKISVKI